MTEEQREKLIEAAVSVGKYAHAPYSRYAVGAAVLTSEGQLFSGCNIENASYGLTNCAERTAMFSAVAAGCKQFVALAIATESGQTPCGACRQVMAEFCDELPILLIDTDNGQVAETTLSELLPRRFRSDGAD